MVDMIELVRRKNAILSGEVKLEDCERYNPYLPEAISDIKLATFYFKRDVIVHLQDERLKQNLSMKQVAERMGVDEDTIMEFESYNERYNTIIFMVKYAMALNKKLTIQIEDNKCENTNPG